WPSSVIRPRPRSCARERACRGRRAVARPVRTSDDVRDHGEEPEVEDPDHEQGDEPRFAIQMPGVQQGADPGHEAGDQPDHDRETAGDADPEERPGESAPRSPTISGPFMTKVSVATAVHAAAK